MKLLVEVEVNESQVCHGEIENCIKWSMIDGMMHHFEFWRPELKEDAVYEYMARCGFRVLSVARVSGVDKSKIGGGR